MTIQDLGIGPRVAAARRAAGFSQEQLARAADLERSALAKVERGLRRLDALELARLSRALDRPMEWFVAEVPPDLLAFLRQHAQDIAAIGARYGASNFRVFGSVARGDTDLDSDIDLLVDLAPGTSLFGWAGLHAALEDLLGLPVDVGTEKTLRPEIKERALADAIPL